MDALNELAPFLGYGLMVLCAIGALFGRVDFDLDSPPRPMLPPDKEP